MHITNKTINGVDCEVHANGSIGMWSINLEGKTLGSGDTLDKAIEAARLKMRKAKVSVSVPFITFAGKRGNATGIHAGTGKVLARIDGGRSEQVERYSRALRADTPAETVQRMVELQDQIDAAKREMGAIEREHKLNLGEEVQKAVDAAATTD